MGYTPISERVATVTFVAFRAPSRARTIDRLSITGLSPAADLAAHRASFQIPVAEHETGYHDRASIHRCSYMFVIEIRLDVLG